MGEIIPFIARVRSGGDWSAAERARLDALADQFERAGLRVEVVYGVTDNGDPWCVIKDEDEEVLLHVARIDGRFVVHEAADDSLREASDLPAVLGRQLAMMDDPASASGHASGEVVPFAAGGRQFQGLIALLVATAFIYDHRDTHGLVALDVRADPLPEEPVHAPPAPEVVADHEVREAGRLAQVWAAAPEAAPSHAGAVAVVERSEAPVSAPAADTVLKVASIAEGAPGVSHGAAPTVDVSAHAQAEARPHLIQGTDRAEVLVGTAHADLIRGGAGDDTLSGGGAGPGQYDTLDGGAGNDRILVDSHTIAIGGAGADIFVIEAPRLPDHPETFLGFIVDFHPEDGDRFVNRHGDAVGFVHPDAAFFDHFHPQAPPPGVMPGTTSTVFVDLNGDGRPDGYLVVGHGTGDPPLPPHDDPGGKAPPPSSEPGEPDPLSVGRPMVHDPLAWAAGG